jgi:hypothetical protein
VIRFLSREWVDAFNHAIERVEVSRPGPAAGLATRDGRFSMCQVVTDGPDGEVRTTLHVNDGRVAMSVGDDGSADVTIRMGWADAVAMAAGELAPTEAIAAGRVRVRGDLAVLTEAQQVLSAVAPQLADLRNHTEY